MRIIQLSDSHLSSAKPARAAELDACISFINNLKSPPDAVVHTGDVAHDGLVEEYRTAKLILDKLTTPYFVLPGNRDNRREMSEVFADGRHIQPGMSFLQYAVEDFSVRMIMVDTMSATSNKGQLCEYRLAHIRQMLSSEPSRPAVLFLHHPPFTVNVGPEPQNFATWSEAEALMAEIKRHKHVLGIFCGHVHRSFDASIGSLKVSVVSSVVSDLRWDRPKAAEQNLPIFNIYDIPARNENSA